MPSEFWVADFRANGDLRARTPYQYRNLELLPGCSEIIGQLSGEIWKSPSHFIAMISTGEDALSVRWTSTAPTSGVMTLLSHSVTLSVTILASGLRPESDELTFAALQQRLLLELHGTEHEASFEMTSVSERPLAATLDIATDRVTAGHQLVAVIDRCFAAAYFRFLGLA